MDLVEVEEIVGKALKGRRDDVVLAIGRRQGGFRQGLKISGRVAAN